jgi:hypothetical protein
MDTGEALMDPLALRALIKKTLSPLGLYSLDAEELLMATCAQESLLGKYRRQGNNGPAIGIFQMEPNTFNDIWQNYLAYHEQLADGLRALASTQPPRPIEMLMNDPFAICMCRVHYLRVPHPMPSGTSLQGLWGYYKVYYNSVLGAATQEEFVRNYKLTGGSAS